MVFIDLRRRRGNSLSVDTFVQRYSIARTEREKDRERLLLNVHNALTGFINKQVPTVANTSSDTLNNRYPGDGRRTGTSLRAAVTLQPVDPDRMAKCQCRQRERTFQAREGANLERNTVPRIAAFLSE